MHSVLLCTAVSLCVFFDDRKTAVGCLIRSGFMWYVGCAKLGPTPFLGGVTCLNVVVVLLGQS